MKRGWKSQICELIIARINPDILSWLPLLRSGGNLPAIGASVLMSPLFSRAWLSAGLSVQGTA